MSFSVSTGVLAQLIGSLLEGSGNNIIEKKIFEKIESYGKDVISDLIRATPLGAGLSAVKRYKNFIGMSDREFKQSRDDWLNTLMQSEGTAEAARGSKGKGRSQGGVGSGLIDKIKEAFVDYATSEAGQPWQKGKWKWSKSRQEWLDESWKHDWRSQPRNAFGRWIDGRLNYIYVAKGKASKKVRSARRRAARKRVNWNQKTGNYE